MCFRRKVCRVGRVQVRSRPLEIIPAVRRSRLYLSTRESAGCRQVEERGNCRIGLVDRLVERISTHCTKQGGTAEVVFSDRGMTYRGREITYENATGIAFSKSSSSGRFLYTLRGSVLVHSPSVRIKIRFGYPVF